MAVQAKESPGMSGLVSWATGHRLSGPVCITIMKSPSSIEMILRAERTICLEYDLGVGEKKCPLQICQPGVLPSLGLVWPQWWTGKVWRKINGLVFAKAERSDSEGEASLSDSFKPQGLQLKDHNSSRAVLLDLNVRTKELIVPQVHFGPHTYANPPRCKEMQNVGLWCLASYTEGCGCPRGEIWAIFVQTVSLRS